MSEAFRGSEDFGEYLKCAHRQFFNFVNSLHRLQSNVIIKTYGLFMKLILESGNQKEKI